MKRINTFIAWLLLSSNDAEKTSLAAKSLLLFTVPFLMKGIAISCGLGFACLSLTNDGAKEIVETVSNLIYLLLSVISVTGILFGLIRKIGLTAAGRNAVLTAMRRR